MPIGVALSLGANGDKKLRKHAWLRNLVDDGAYDVQFQLNTHTQITGYEVIVHKFTD